MPIVFGQLIPVGGGNAIPLRAAKCIVGRATDCDVVLPYRTVSSKHCLLEVRNGAWFVTDLASSNGIRIDGARCREGYLSRESVLSIAEYRFEVVFLSSGQQSPDETLSLRNMTEELDSEISHQSATQIPVPVAAPAATSTASPVAPPVASEPAQPFTPSPSLPPAGTLSPSGPSLGELIPLDGGASIPLRSSRLLIGRAAVCHIVLPYPEVSGKHCQLDLHEGQWHVRDLGSRNGIQVDGKPQTAAPLKANAILSIAKHRFKIVYEPKINDFELGNEPIATIDLGEVMPTDRVMFDVFPEPARDFEGADSDEHSASDICAAP